MQAHSTRLARTLLGAAITLLSASMASAAPQPDDSEAARQAALSRLRAAPLPSPASVCDDGATMSRTHGSSCLSREFAAPPLLAAPRMAWSVKPGWWGVWSPFLVGRLMLTGSCNNDGNEGISALDQETGRIVWRIASVCATGNRRGSSGQVAFHELPSGEVLLVYARDDGGPPDHYVIDVRAGRIVRTLTPVKRGPLRQAGGVFSTVSQSNSAGRSTIHALDASLERILWQNDGFRLAMDRQADRYRPTFSPPAGAGGLMFQTARSLEQPEPPTRQLQAIDLRDGRTLWRHTAQPVAEQGPAGGLRSDDGTPMVAGGRVIVRVQGLLGAARSGHAPSGDGLRAFEPRSGTILWTTDPQPGQSLGNRVAALDLLVSEAEQGGRRSLLAHRLADGRPVWERPVQATAQLLASAGGVLYVSERPDPKTLRLSGLDGATGTLLWRTDLPAHNMNFEALWGIEDLRGGIAQGPAWRIGRDGAIYGVRLDGAYKLQ